MCLCTWHSHRDLWWVFLVAHYFTSSSFGFLVALSVSWSALPHLSVTLKSCLLFQTQAENRREEQFLQKPKRRRHHSTSRAHCTYTERKQQHPCTVLLKHCPKLHRLWCLSFWFGGLVHFKKCIVCLHAHHSTHVGIRLAEVCCFLPPRGFWRLNSGHHIWWQVPLLSEPYCQPSHLSLVKKKKDTTHVVTPAYWGLP